MAPTFQKAPQNRIFQNVVEQIQQAILVGSFKVGEQLPSELRLKEMFATSRGSIREALRVLEQKGLIDIKTGAGGGPVVKAVGTQKIAEQLSFLMQCQRVTFEQLVEFREGVEGIVSGLAAERATPKDLSRLRQLIAEARSILDAAEPDVEAFLRADMSFHVALAEAAGNPMYLANLQVVHERVLGAFDRASLLKGRILQENFQDLLDIADAVEKRQTKRATTLARNHVRRFLDHMERSPRGRPRRAGAARATARKGEP